MRSKGQAQRVEALIDDGADVAAGVINSIESLTTGADDHIAPAMQVGR